MESYGLKSISPGRTGEIVPGTDRPCIFAWDVPDPDLLLYLYRGTIT